VRYGCLKITSCSVDSIKIEKQGSLWNNATWESSYLKSRGSLRFLQKKCNNFLLKTLFNMNEIFLCSGLKWPKTIHRMGQVVGTYGCTHKVDGSTLCGGVWPSIILHLGDFSKLKTRSKNAVLVISAVVQTSFRHGKWTFLKLCTTKKM
jgi:hypothetical protein